MRLRAHGYATLPAAHCGPYCSNAVVDGLRSCRRRDALSDGGCSMQLLESELSAWHRSQRKDDMYRALPSDGFVTKLDIHFCA
jgi:hypothetical protein